MEGRKKERKKKEKEEKKKKEWKKEEGKEGRNIIQDSAFPNPYIFPW